MAFERSPDALISFGVAIFGVFRGDINNVCPAVMERIVIDEHKIIAMRLLVVCCFIAWNADALQEVAPPNQLQEFFRDLLAILT